MIEKLSVTYSGHAIQRMWERKVDPFNGDCKVAKGHVLHEIRLACPGHCDVVTNESPFVYFHRRKKPASIRQRDIFVTTFEGKNQVKVITVFSLDIDNPINPKRQKHETLQGTT